MSWKDGTDDQRFAWLAENGWRYVKGRWGRLWRESPHDADDAWQEALAELIQKIVREGSSISDEQQALYEASRRFWNAYRRLRRSSTWGGRLGHLEDWNGVASTREAAMSLAVDRGDLQAIRFWLAVDDVPQHLRPAMEACLEAFADQTEVEPPKVFFQRVRPCIERRCGPLGKQSAVNRMYRFRLGFWEHLRERGLVKGERP